MAVFTHILVAIDGSPLSAHATDVAVDLSNSLQAQLAFVYVLEPIAGIAPEGGLPAGALLTDLREEARRVLQTAVSRAQQADPPPWSFMKEGKPANEIVSTAREWGADLVVMGTHGRSALGRVVLGSVAQAVVHEARCPVLIVRDGAGA